MRFFYEEWKNFFQGAVIFAGALALAGFGCGGSDDDDPVVQDADLAGDASVAEDAGIAEDAGKQGQGIEYTTGTFTDPRDDSTYKTVSFEMEGAGSFTIMAENMRYTGTADAPIAYRSANGDSANDDVYGLLYDWQTASEKVCPEGWHLPTETEVYQFMIYVRENKTSGSLFDAVTAKSSAWVNYANQSTDEIGLGILPAGKWESDSSGGGEYKYFRESGNLWTNTQENGLYQSFYLHATEVYESDGAAHQIFAWLKEDSHSALSVRCVK